MSRRLFDAWHAAIQWISGLAKARSANLVSAPPELHELEAHKSDQCPFGANACSRDISPFLKEARFADDQLVANLFGLTADSGRHIVRAIYQRPHDYLEIQHLLGSGHLPTQTLADWIVFGP